MKNPLHYQLSEYDCGPTSILNAVNFLFEREEIPPEVLRNVMLYCLDCYSPDGTPGKSGTSASAMMFLSNWLNNFGKANIMPVSSSYLSGEMVYISSSSSINDALKRGGAVVVRLFYDEWHYILLTGIESDNIYAFDPYYREEPFDNKNIKIVLDKPFEYNRIIPASLFNSTEEKLYSLANPESREAVIIYNEKTKITADDTVEYFI